MVMVPEWLRPLYPFHPRLFTTPRGPRLSYLDEGEGSEAVLMLHGNPTWSFYYRDLVKAVSPRRRCIVPDHIGMGLSDKPQRYPYTLATRVDDVAALVFSLGLTKVDLVVHDWGGAIGFGFASRFPDLVRRIVILNTAAFPAPHIPSRIALCKLPGIGTWIVRGLNGFALPATFMAMYRRALTDTEKRAYLMPYNSWANRVAVDAFVKDIPMAPDHVSWPALKQAERAIDLVRGRPTLIYWGGRDFCFNDWFWHSWRERLPEARATRLPDVGHYVLDDAASEVVPRVTDFLCSTDSAKKSA